MCVWQMHRNARLSVCGLWWCGSGGGGSVCVCVCVFVCACWCGLYTSHALNRKCKLSADVRVCVTAILCCVYTVCVCESISVCASEEAAVQAAACARSGTLKQNRDTVCVCVFVSACVSPFWSICVCMCVCSCVFVCMQEEGGGVVILATHLR